jgi:hypothetical protein
MLCLNLNKLALFLFVSAFPNFSAAALENRQELSSSMGIKTKTGTSIHNPIGVTGKTGHPGLTDLTALGISDSNGSSALTDSVENESCSLWQKFFVYLYCVEISGLGTSMAAGKPPLITRPTCINQEEIDACRNCIGSFKDCCESKIQAHKKSNS